MQTKQKCGGVKPLRRACSRSFAAVNKRPHFEFVSNRNLIMKATEQNFHMQLFVSRYSGALRDSRVKEPSKNNST